MFPSILIVDDEASILQSLEGLLSDEGFDVLSASNGYEALKLLDSESPDLVLLDIWMPGIDGIETLKEIKRTNPFLQVIIITGHGNIETAVRATKLGAFDLIEKPLSIDKIIVTINNALNFRRLAEENRYLRKKTLEKNSITGSSAPTENLKRQIAVAAPTEAGILISGENGTGKELVTRTIHQLSGRAEHPLVAVNCAAIPAELMAREMFGYEKGAFDGAVSRKRGQLELAASGTIFFDEIADMDLQTQAKILRVIEQRTYQRVGGSRSLDLKARIIAATNKDLEAEISRGRFREDLYYRLNIIPIEVPPLRERAEDIPVLVDVFLQGCARRNHGPLKLMAPEALQLLQRYQWPGNVRELKNLIERLDIMVDGHLIEADDLPTPYNPRLDGAVHGLTDALMRMDNFKEAKLAFEAAYLQGKLTQYGHNITRTAEAIGTERSYLSKRAKQLDLIR